MDPFRDAPDRRHVLAGKLTRKVNISVGTFFEQAQLSKCQLSVIWRGCSLFPFDSYHAACAWLFG